jgi:hypothetical protein
MSAPLDSWRLISTDAMGKGGYGTDDEPNGSVVDCCIALLATSVTIHSLPGDTGPSVHFCRHKTLHRPLRKVCLKGLHCCTCIHC